MWLVLLPIPGPSPSALDNQTHDIHDYHRGVSTGKLLSDRDNNIRGPSLCKVISVGYDANGIDSRVNGVEGILRSRSQEQ